ncbi:MAG: TRAP transporter substrate-binding protein DctP [Synergistes jonesii]|uniref:TRAP transporter substrate-binding protein DctP n=1 Tax=Synergistes jonesii TaxID=2754 RepID=UPI002A755CFC|nr:TRAP transporter substrate-binding protein DctP [Synergistes jonesii]MDY2985581.1 TRAP transporter substrate-binding protein DctP [Synergistes jonesii]
MKKRTIFTALMVLCLSTFIFVGISFAAPVLKIAHPRPLQSETQTELEAFVEDVEKGTEGRVKCKIYGANQLGSPEQVMENVGMGTVEMLLGWPNTTLDKRFEVYCLPGAVGTYEEGRKLYKQGSPFIKLLNDVYGKFDQVIIAAYPSGFQYSSFKNEPPKSVYDPYAKKNMKIRQASLKYLVYITDGLGYTTSVLPWGEIFTALQTGIIDGLGSFSAESTYLTLRDAIKYTLPISTYLDVFFLTINKEVLDGFSDADRAAVAKAAARFQEKRFDRVVASDKEYLEKLSKHGVTVMPVTEEQKKAFQKRIKEYVWLHLRKDLGADFFDKATKAVEDSLK